MSEPEKPTPPKKTRTRKNPQTVADVQTLEFLASMRDNTGIVVVVRSWSPGQDKPDLNAVRWSSGIPRSGAAAVLWRAAVELDPDIANLLGAADDEESDEEDDDEIDE